MNKKNLKKCFSVFFAFVLTMALFSPSAVSAKEVENEENNSSTFLGSANDMQQEQTYAGDLISVFADEPELIDPIITTPFSDYSLILGETKSWDVELFNKSPLPNIDIMYIVDTTGSMASRRQMVADTLIEFTTSLDYADADSIQIGTAFFGDQSIDDPWHEITLPLGEYPIDEIIDKIQNLTAVYGGDANEDALLALMNVVNQTDWRPDAQHVVILITDAATKTHPDLYIGGFPVTFEGARDLIEANNIQSSLCMNYGVAIGDISGALDVPERPWVTADELLEKLQQALISTPATVIDRNIEIRTSVTYVSDDTPSSDIILTISDDTFLLMVDELKTVHFTAQAVTSPSRPGDAVRAVIEFSSDGELIGTAAQILTLYPSDAAVIYIQPDEAYADFPSDGIIKLPINIANNPGISSYAIMAEIPSSLAPYITNISVEGGSVTSSFINGINPTFAVNTAYLSGMSAVESSIDGTMVYLCLDMDPAAPAGRYPIVINVGILSTIRGGMPVIITNYVVENGYIDIQKARYGDIDGDAVVTIMDAMMVMAYIAGTSVFSPAQLAAADVDLNGIVNINDATMIQWAAAGQAALPSGTRTLYKICEGSVPAGSAGASLETLRTLELLEVIPYNTGIISIPVSIQNNPDIAGFHFAMHYDSSVLRPIGYTYGDIWSDAVSANFETGGNCVEFAGAGSSTVEADGSILHVLFEQLNPAGNAADHVELEVFGLVQMQENKAETLDGYTTSGTDIIFE